jgi:hypothetical protein
MSIGIAVVVVGVAAWVLILLGAKKKKASQTSEGK